MLACAPLCYAQESTIENANRQGSGSQESKSTGHDSNPISWEYQPTTGMGENKEPGSNETLNRNLEYLTKNLKELEYLTKNLKELEIQYGPYHVSIADNLIKLAQLYSELNEYEQARDSIERALEVQRITMGLYGTGQIPIVEQLILVNRQLERWSDIDKNYEFLYWLYRRAYGENAPELMPMLRHYTDWKIEVLNRGIFTSRLPFIRTALKAAKRANYIINNTPELQQMSPYFMQLENSLKEANKVETAQNRPSF